MGKALSDLPTEVLISIFLQVHSAREFESLGLTWSKFYKILGDYDYTSHSRIQDQLWTIQNITYKPSRSSQGLHRRLLLLSDESSWSTELISQSICDAAAASERCHIILKGCREWVRKEDILICRVQTIWGEHDAEAIGSWIRALHLRQWSNRLIKTFRLEASRLADNDNAYVAYKLPNALRSEFRLAGQFYDLSDVASCVAVRTPPKMAKRLIWGRDNTWESYEGGEMY
jgi:hypothetical protein